MSAELMTVTMIGGPLDGEEVRMPVTYREWRVPMAEMPEIWQDDGSQEYTAKMIDGLRHGIYAARGKPTEFHWLGESPRPSDAARTEKAERLELARLKRKYEGMEQTNG